MESGEWSLFHFIWKWTRSDSEGSKSAIEEYLLKRKEYFENASRTAKTKEEAKALDEVLFSLYFNLDEVKSARKKLDKITVDGTKSPYLLSSSTHRVYKTRYSEIETNMLLGAAKLVGMPRRLAYDLIMYKHDSIPSENKFFLFIGFSAVRDRETAEKLLDESISPDLCRPKREGDTAGLEYIINKAVGAAAVEDRLLYPIYHQRWHRAQLT